MRRGNLQYCFCHDLIVYVGKVDCTSVDESHRTLLKGTSVVLGQIGQCSCFSR